MVVADVGDIWEPGLKLHVKLEHKHASSFNKYLNGKGTMYNVLVSIYLPKSKV